MTHLGLYWPKMEGDKFSHPQNPNFRDIFKMAAGLRSLHPFCLHGLTILVVLLGIWVFKGAESI